MSLTLPKLFEDEKLRRHHFPVTSQGIFLAHAGVAPLPRIASEAVQEEARQASLSDQEGVDFIKKIDTARRMGARLIHAQSDEIALLGPTSLGLNLVANGLVWKPGDEVVFYQDDYPANVYPWQHLESQGVRLVRVQPKETGRITPDTVFSVLSSRTRLVALASCHFLTGWRLDYQAIGEELQKRGVLFCLDAIQSLGATAVDARHVDFLCADSHKWMLGPCGAGIFYVKKERLEILRPSLFGSWNIESPYYTAQEKMTFQQGARRYEPGSLYLLGIVGMTKALELLLEVGIDQIERRLLHLHAFTTKKLQEIGYRVQNANGTAEEKSGIVTATKSGVDLKLIFDRLRQEKITVSLRSGRDGQPYLRLSPHFYNVETEIEHVIEILK